MSEFFELWEFVGGVRVLGIVRVVGFVRVLGVFCNICYIIVINNRKIIFSILTVLFKKNLDERHFFQFGVINFCGNSFVKFANNFFNQVVMSLPSFQPVIF